MAAAQGYLEISFQQIRGSNIHMNMGESSKYLDFAKVRWEDIHRPLKDLEKETKSAYGCSG